jgi:hypothetical protein
MKMLLREMEEHMRWKHFAVWPSLCDGLKALLASPTGQRMQERDASAARPRLQQIRERVDAFHYDGALEARSRPEPATRRGERAKPAHAS